MVRPLTLHKTYPNNKKSTPPDKENHHGYTCVPTRLIGITGVLAYHRANLRTFTATFVAALALGSVLDIVGQYSWITFLLIAIPLNVISLRKNLLSKPALKAFKGVMPEMSRTEKEAIDAGTVWWEADLFRGAPDWNKLHDIPAPRLSAEEKAFLDGPVNEVSRMVNDFQVTHELADLPPEVWQYLKDHKFFRHDHQKGIRRPGIFSLCPITSATKANRCICCTLFNCRCS